MQLLFNQIAPRSPEAIGDGPGLRAYRRGHTNDRSGSGRATPPGGPSLSPEGTHQKLPSTSHAHTRQDTTGDQHNLADCKSDNTDLSRLKI